jgi:hypothetical protein
MLTRHGDEALAEALKRTDQLTSNADLAGVAVWLRIIEAIRLRAEATPTGSLH